MCIFTLNPFCNIQMLIYLFIFFFKGAEFDKKLSIPPGHQHSGTETEAQWNQFVSHQVRTRERLGLALLVFAKFQQEQSTTSTPVFELNSVYLCCLTDKRWSS